jgi:molecular chaperone GrpE (heat shock protein)
MVQERILRLQEDLSELRRRVEAEAEHIDSEMAARFAAELGEIHRTLDGVEAKIRAIRETKHA